MITRAQRPVVYTVTEGMLREQYAIKTVMPEFPKSALEHHVSGLVAVKLEVDENGNVSKVEPDQTPIKYGEIRVGNIGAPDEWEPRGPFTSDASVLKAVVTAVEQWKCKPFVVGEKRVRMRTVLTFKFEILDGEERVDAGTIACCQSSVTFSDEESASPCSCRS
jgi:hypothetical protein